MCKARQRPLPALRGNVPGMRPRLPRRHRDILMGMIGRATLIAASALLAGLAACRPADRTTDEESNARAAANTTAVEVPAPPRDTAGSSPQGPSSRAAPDANLPPAAP